ncbi:MAG: hypothetical protein KIT25_03890 [Enhydrobacter sp.]|nr:MAG: hypothetical protein KIT25_03890 [Enhydrobacter sp.]
MRLPIIVSVLCMLVVGASSAQGIAAESQRRSVVAADASAEVRAKAVNAEASAEAGATLKFSKIPAGVSGEAGVRQ